MISINKLPQAKKNLEQDLKRNYDSVCKALLEEVTDILSDVSDPSSEFSRLVSMTEDELIVYFIEKENPELSEDEKKEFKEEVEETIKGSKAWKSFSRYLSMVYRYRRYISPYPRVLAAWLTLSYDMIVHPILFSNWHWKDFDGFGFDQFSKTLSSEEVYDGLRNCNPDMVSVCISNLENCSIADKEILQEAFDNDQRVVFIEKLKTLSPSDYYCLGLITSWFHYENALLSFDWETLQILLYHMDFGDEVGLDLSVLPNEDCMNLIVEPFDENDPSDDNFIAYFDAISETLEPLVNLLISNVYSYLKYNLPRAIESIKPFPFERKYLDDVLSIPEVKSILDELPENSKESNLAPEDQEQPEPQRSTVPPVDRKPREDEATDTASPREIIDEDGLRRLSDDAFISYNAIDGKKAYFTESMIDTATALRMSVIYDLYQFLVGEGKLENSQEALNLFALRLTGKDPYGINDKTKKLVWKGITSDYSLCYFLWKMFSKELGHGQSHRYDTQYWSKAENFFIYADGRIVDGRDEQNNRQQFTNKTGQDIENSFAKALRSKLAGLQQKQAELKSKSK